MYLLIYFFLYKQEIKTFLYYYLSKYPSVYIYLSIYLIIHLSIYIFLALQNNKPKLKQKEPIHFFPRRDNSILYGLRDQAYIYISIYIYIFHILCRSVYKYKNMSVIYCSFPHYYLSIFYLSFYLSFYPSYQLCICVSLFLSFYLTI